MQANGFVANRKDAATQVEVEMTEMQPVSATEALKARKRLQSAQNLSFVSLLPFFNLIQTGPFLLLLSVSTVMNIMPCVT